MGHKSLPANISLSKVNEEVEVTKSEEFNWKRALLIRSENGSNAKKYPLKTDEKKLNLERELLSLFQEDSVPLLNFYVDASDEKLDYSLNFIRELLNSSLPHFFNRLVECQKIQILIRDTYTKVSLFHMTPQKTSQSIIESINHDKNVERYSSIMKVGHLNRALMGEQNVLQISFKHKPEIFKTSHLKGRVNYDKSI